MRWDSVLGETWVQVVSCDHPEWPPVELAVRGRRMETTESVSGDELFPQLPVVRAGDAVELWSMQDDIRIEVAAIAEQSGALGKTVRVRLMHRETLGSQIEEQFMAVVRGPHDVEMLR
jgi:hypothetical protein